MTSKAAALFSAQLALILLLLAVPGPCWPVGACTWPLPAGILLSGFGTALFLLGLFALGHNLRPLPAPKSGGRLVTTGVYRRVRHPIYSGGLIAALGFALATRSPMRLLWWAMLALVLDVKARYEEELLSRRFAEYEDYRRKSRRFIPWVY